MHTRVSSHRERTDAHRLRQCCDSTFAASARAKRKRDEGEGERRLRAALDVMAARFSTAPLWAGGMSFGSWIGFERRRRRRPRVDAARRRPSQQ